MIENSTKCATNARKRQEIQWSVVFWKVVFMTLHLIVAMMTMSGFLRMKTKEPITPTERFLQESELLLPLLFLACVLGFFFDVSGNKYHTTIICLLVVPFNILLILVFFLQATVDLQTPDTCDGCLFNQLTNVTIIDDAAVGVDEALVMRYALQFVAHLRCGFVDVHHPHRFQFGGGFLSLSIFFIEMLTIFMKERRSNVETGLVSLIIFLIAVLVVPLFFHITMCVMETR